jgi:hypothetical protein
MFCVASLTSTLVTLQLPCVDPSQQYDYQRTNQKRDRGTRCEGVLLWKSTVPLQVDIPPNLCDPFALYLYLSCAMTQYPDKNVLPGRTYFYRLSNADGTKWISQILVVTVPQNTLTGLTQINTASCLDTSTFFLVVVVGLVSPTDPDRNVLITLPTPATPITPNPFPSFTALVSLSQPSSVVTVTFSISGPSGTGTYDTYGQTITVYLSGLPLTLAGATTVQAIRVSQQGSPIGTSVSSAIPAALQPATTCAALFGV